MFFLKKKIIGFSDDLELEDPIYTGKFENRIALYFLLVYGLWQVILMRSEYILFENIVNVILDTISFAPVILIATRPLDFWFKKRVNKTHALDIMIFFIGFYSFYFLLAQLLYFQHALPYIARVENFLFPQNFYLNYIFLMICFLFFFRFPFYLLDLRKNREGILTLIKECKKHYKLWIHYFAINILGIFFLYGYIKDSMGSSAFIIALLVIPVFLLILSLSQCPKLKYNIKYDEEHVFSISDLFSILFLGPCLLFTLFLPFASSWSVFFFLVALIYGTSIGREHFYYSYSPQSSKNIIGFIDMVIISFLILIPLGLVLAFIDLNDFTLQVDFIELYKAICTWTFYVGIGEEVIFRVGILILFSDLFRVKNIKRHKTWGLIFSSLIFGLLHAPKGWNYAILAIVAGFLYGILFLKGRSMFGPMMLHMTVDVIAVKFFGAQL